MTGELKENEIEAILAGKMTPELENLLRSQEGRVAVARLMVRMRIAGEAGAMQLASADAAKDIPQEELDQLMRLAEQAYDDEFGTHVRKLAVMFCNLLDSAQYAEQHGDTSAKRKQETYYQLLAPRIAEHGGTLIQNVGDALMATFEGIREAARCAISIQQRLFQYNHSSSVTQIDQQIHVRAGIDSGKAVTYRWRNHLDVTGSAVAIAACVEAGCREDQILLSETAFTRLVRYQDEFRMIERGTIFNEGMGPVRLFQLLWREDEPIEKEALRLAAATAAELERRMEEAENTRGIHCAFVDPESGSGYIRPVFVRAVASESGRVQPRVDCGRVMHAAAIRAVQAAFGVLQRLGFEDARIDRTEVEWWIGGPAVRYEGASIGLGVALSLVAAYTGLAVDKTTVVTGAIDHDQVIGVAGLADKWEAIKSGGFTSLILAADDVSKLPESAKRWTGASVHAVSTVEDAVIEMFGPSLGLSARRLTELSHKHEVNIEMAVERAEPGGTSDITFVPKETQHTWCVGGHICISAKVDRDCHLSLIAIGPAGTATILLPNRHHQDTLVRANHWVSFPANEDLFSFQLKGPPGLEKIIAIASSRPLKLTPQDFGQSSALVVAKPTTRDIGIIAEDVAGNIIGRDEMQIYVSDNTPSVEGQNRHDVTRGITASTTSGFRSVDLE